MSFFEFHPLRPKKPEEVVNEEEKLLRRYLKHDSPVSYSPHALEITVQDVMALEEDLHAYVLSFLHTGHTETDIACECASVKELLATGDFTPVTAALFIQWYRNNPLEAAAFLMHHDSVVEIPEVLPPCQEE